jgi:hypothetical protein
MEIQRALDLIEDLSATYNKIEFRKTPPQYIVYQHIKTSKKDIIKFLAHNVLSSDTCSWAWDVVRVLYELDHSDGFLFFAIIELAESKDDALLVTLFDKQSNTRKTYIKNLDTLQLEEATGHYFFD